MEDVYDVCANGVLKVGEVVSVAKGLEGVVPKTLSDGQCFVRLLCVGYFSGSWIIVSPSGYGIVCFLPKWSAGKQIESVRIEAERPRSLVGRPIQFLNGGMRVTVK
jgi:hypothetical protein